MKLKRTIRYRQIKYVLVFLLLSMFSMAFPSHARDHTARLKECLQTDTMYYSESIDFLNFRIASSYDIFRKEYADRCIVLSGSKVGEISKNKKEITIVNDLKQECTVDTSDNEIKQVIEGLKVGDAITVYGTLQLTGWDKKSYKIVAKEINTNSNTKFETGSYVFYSDDEFKGTLVDDLTNSQSVKFYVPSSWKAKYVHEDLTNNGVKGHQYYLNAISPQDRQNPEIFSVFFFDYETYLEKRPAKPTDDDKKKIEKEIVRNILQDVEKKAKITVETIKDANGKKLDYFSTSHRASDGRAYRLEFLFESGEKGIVCMLYVYFPSEATVRHVRDVAYLIETMSVE